MHVVVAGAGLLGLCTAWYLRRAGARVTVLDRQPGPGLETSFANGGMLHASQANPWNEPGVLGTALRMLGREDAALLVRPKALPGMWRWGMSFVRHSRPDRYLRNFEKNAHLARCSLEEMQGLKAALGSDYDAATLGTMKLFRTQAEVQGAARLCAQLTDWGIPHEVIDAAGATRLEPALTPIEAQLAGGLYFPGDESGDAHKFCGKLASALAAAGAEFHYKTTILNLRRERPAGVALQTSIGEVRGDAVVLALGSYTPALARRVGLRVPVVPAKGYSITLPVGDWAASPAMPVIDDHLHAAVCPLGDRLRVAGTAEFAGHDLNLTPSRIDNLFHLVLQLYPRFEPHLRRAEATPWTGLRPMSADGVGIMGRTAVPGIFMNTGHGPLGWTMAAGAGRLVADEILGLPPILDNAAYHLARFE
jgi:D-amino-acid dehydrogenase